MTGPYPPPPSTPLSFLAPPLPPLLTSLPKPPIPSLPITRETLRELDLVEIFKNPQLRHDVVFDPHLQFRPNFDGERGVLKRREADRFWHAVEVELSARRRALQERKEAAASAAMLIQQSRPRTGIAAPAKSSSSSSHHQDVHVASPLPLPPLALLPRLIEELREILMSLLPAPPPAPMPTPGAQQQSHPPPPLQPQQQQQPQQQRSSLASVPTTPPAKRPQSSPSEAAGQKIPPNKVSSPPASTTQNSKPTRSPAERQLPQPSPSSSSSPLPPQPQPATAQQGTERHVIMSTLDAELLIQELDHGVLDVDGLFRFLGETLKGHCAPMRDVLVETMVRAVVQSGEIVRGIRMCFEILEWMKL
ncbi:hypothetical protein BGZ73_000982, partial [Actinomortierella ambigua]